MSEIQGDHSMISVINMDGPDRLLMTHYCSVGNQPRMQASVSPDGKVITFTYVDATNLATADAGASIRKAQQGRYTASVVEGLE